MPDIRRSGSSGSGRRRLAAIVWGQREAVLSLVNLGPDYIAAFFGYLYAGVVAVPAYPPRPNEKLHRLRSVASDAQATFGITTSAILPRLESLTAQEENLRALR